MTGIETFQNPMDGKMQKCPSFLLAQRENTFQKVWCEKPFPREKNGHNTS